MRSCGKWVLIALWVLIVVPKSVQANPYDSPNDVADRYGQWSYVVGSAGNQWSPADWAIANKFDGADHYVHFLRRAGLDVQLDVYYALDYKKSRINPPSYVERETFVADHPFPLKDIGKYFPEVEKMLLAPSTELWWSNYTYDARYDRLVAIASRDQALTVALTLSDSFQVDVGRDDKQRHQISARRIGPESLVTDVTWRSFGVFKSDEPLAWKLPYNYFHYALSGYRVVLATINDKPLLPDTPPLLSAEGRVLVPLRAIAEAAQSFVVWNEASRTAKVTRGDRRVEVQIDSLDATLQGQPLKLDVAARLIDGRTYVPLRFISEGLGFKVSWDAANWTASVQNQ